MNPHRYSKYSKYKTHSQDWLVLEVPRVSSELVKTDFSPYAPQSWNDLPFTLKLDSLAQKCEFSSLI